MYDTHYQELIIKAELAVKNAREKMAYDPMRPRYHFLPPAQWMNDPNGTFYKNGYYHVFYQFNPFGDAWDHIHWGHARTKDFLFWERLPIALAPDHLFENEEHCFSGGAVLDNMNNPVLVYTSVSKNRDTTPNKMVFLHSENDAQQYFIKWYRMHNTITINDVNIDIHNDWRDPFIFKKNNKQFMLVGANLKKDNMPTVLCFENTDNTALSWKFKSILKTFEKYNFQFFECPNMLQISLPNGTMKDILIGSPFEPVRYYVGEFNTNNGIFTEELHGFMDYDMSFYASNYFSGQDDRTIIIGWIREFPKGRQWNGCLSLPRECSLDKNGILLQRPIEEIKRLRDPDTQLIFDGTAIKVDSAVAVGMELELEMPASANFSIKDNNNTVLLNIKDQLINIEHIRTTICPTTENSILLNIFFDCSVIECFVNNGKTCITHVIEALHKAEYLILNSNSKECKGQIWKIKPIRYEDKSYIE